MTRAKQVPSDDTEDLEIRVQRLLPRLTPKQHRLARALLSDQMFVAFASAEDVGRIADVDSATVVRFSRLLGYEGFADLRDAIRRRIPQFLTEIERVSRSLEGSPVGQDSMVDVFAQDLRNLEETARANSSDSLEAVVRALDKAERVYCLAQGISLFVADYMTHQLALIGIDAMRSPRSAVEAAMLFPTVNARDVVVVVSVWRYLEEIFKLTSAVRASGATIVSLVDNKSAPVVALSPIHLVGETVTPRLGHSMTGLMTLVNVLVTGVAIANPNRALNRLSQIEAYYGEANLIRKPNRD